MTLARVYTLSWVPSSVGDPATGMESNDLGEILVRREGHTLSDLSLAVPEQGHGRSRSVSSKFILGILWRCSVRDKRESVSDRYAGDIDRLVVPPFKEFICVSGFAPKAIGAESAEASRGCHGLPTTGKRFKK